MNVVEARDLFNRLMFAAVMWPLSEQPKRPLIPKPRDKFRHNARESIEAIRWREELRQ